MSIISYHSAPNPDLHSFPTRRSSDLLQQNGDEPPNLDPYLVYTFEKAGRYLAMIRDCAERSNPNYVYRLARIEDRKSTRLNSSHITISYAVFCLKKKTNYPSTLTIPK